VYDKFGNFIAVYETLTTDRGLALSQAQSQYPEAASVEEKSENVPHEVRG
jgi:hypothetical protein